MRNRTNWRLTSVAQLHNVLALITVFALERQHVAPTWFVMDSETAEV